MDFGTVQLRRLSTKSAVELQGHAPLSTKWVWYWQDDGDVWRTYGHGKEVRVQWKMLDCVSCFGNGISVRVRVCVCVCVCVCDYFS